MNVDNLSKTYGNSSIRIKFNFDIEDITLELEKSITIGLILNELISNALKYAFKDRDKGENNIQFKKESNGEIKRFNLVVSDNGAGLPENFKEKIHLDWSL